MAISTFIIGVLPTYDQIGIWAPIILLIARIMQGFSVGGEYAGAMVYIAESSPDNKRIRLGSGLELGTLSGYIFASVLITIMFWLIPSESMQSWGWRIPFFVSIPIGLFGLYLRSHLEESPIFENDLANHQEDEPGFLQTIKENKRDILLCVVFVAFFNITNYMLLGYMPSYLDEIVGIKDTISTPITAVVLIIMLPFAIMFGRLGDKSGNKKIISVGLILGIVFSIISFQFLNGGNLGFLFIGLLMIGIVLSVYEGTMPEHCQHYSLQM